jgi:hypothetical protein
MEIAFSRSVAFVSKAEKGSFSGSKASFDNAA